MTSIIKRTTPNYGLLIPYFDSPNWGSSIERDLDLLDAVILAATGVGSVIGVWGLNTTYEAGQRVVDSADNTIWQCLITHMSPVTGTFDDERTAHPTYWLPISYFVLNRGNWATATAYNANEFLQDGQRFGVVTGPYTSGASYDADVLAGHIDTLINLTASLASATASAAAAAADAAIVANTKLNPRNQWLTATVYAKNDLVFQAGSQYICLVAHTSGVFATDLTNSKWFIFAQQGGSGAGSGDMLASVYDPGTKHADAFSMANMVETSTKKIMSDVERTKLAGVDTGAQVTSASLVGTAVDAGGAKGTFTTSDKIAILDAATGDALKYITGTVLEAFLKAYTDTLYNSLGQFSIAVSDEGDAISAGVAKVTFRMPFAGTLMNVRASLNTASSSGNVVVDINESGTTVLSTKLSIDAGEKTSTTAATPVVISDNSIADDAEITIDIDSSGTGAKGLKVILYIKAD